MERKEEIAKLCKDRAEAADLVEEILFLESKLTELKKLRFTRYIQLTTANKKYFRRQNSTRKCSSSIQIV